jgi:hypothetical protein
VPSVPCVARVVGGHASLGGEPLHLSQAVLVGGAARVRFAAGTARAANLVLQRRLVDLERFDARPLLQRSRDQSVAARP